MLLQKDGRNGSCVSHMTPNHPLIALMFSPTRDFPTTSIPMSCPPLGIQHVLLLRGGSFSIMDCPIACFTPTQRPLHIARPCILDFCFIIYPLVLHKLVRQLKSRLKPWAIPRFHCRTCPIPIFHLSEHQSSQWTMIVFPSGHLQCAQYCKSWLVSPNLNPDAWVHKEPSSIFRGRAAKGFSFKTIWYA